MTLKKLKILIAKSVLYLTIPVVVISCKLTRTNVIGQWKVPDKDTLNIYPDNTFKLSKTHYIQNKQFEKVDSIKSYMDGQWKLNKKTLRFTFNDTTQNLGRGCKFYQYMWAKGSKKTLFRGDSCFYPSNRFVAIQKIK